MILLKQSANKLFFIHLELTLDLLLVTVILTKREIKTGIKLIQSGCQSKQKTLRCV